jgi:hypothetical protein
MTKTKCIDTIKAQIPKGWVDVSELIEIINFSLIKTFYEDEYLPRKKEFETSSHNKKFSKWLEDSYNYLTIEMPKISKEIEKLLTNMDFQDRLEKNNENGKVYYTLKPLTGNKKRKYNHISKKVELLEKGIKKSKSSILNNLIKYREIFWT